EPLSVVVGSASAKDLCDQVYPSLDLPKMCVARSTIKAKPFALVIFIPFFATRLRSQTGKVFESPLRSEGCPCRPESQAAHLTGGISTHYDGSVPLLRRRIVAWRSRFRYSFRLARRQQAACLDESQFGFGAHKAIYLERGFPRGLKLLQRL